MNVLKLAHSGDFIPQKISRQPDVAPHSQMPHAPLAIPLRLALRPGAQLRKLARRRFGLLSSLDIGLDRGRGFPTQLE